VTAAGVALTTIVLVHGLGGDRHVWDDVRQRLARSGVAHDVLTVELPGHGENLPGPKAPSIDAAARQVAARIRQAHAAPAIVVGHSLGGIVAAHVPLVDAGAVEALVLVDIPIGPTWAGDEIAQMQHALATDRDRALRDWFGAICQPSQYARLLVGLGKLSNDALVGWMHAMKDGAVPDGGRALVVPTLLMASPLVLPGKKPRAAELADAGYAHVARLQVETFAQSKHWIMWDEPDKFVAVLAKFVRAVEGPSFH